MRSAVVNRNYEMIDTTMSQNRAENRAGKLCHTEGPAIFSSGVAKCCKGKRHLRWSTYTRLPVYIVQHLTKQANSQIVQADQADQATLLVQCFVFFMLNALSTVVPKHNSIMCTLFIKKRNDKKATSRDQQVFTVVIGFGSLTFFKQLTNKRLLPAASSR